MKKLLFLAAFVLFATGCSLVSPYTITFTNTPGSEIVPTTSTLDFVVSAPTLAYISNVACEGADAITLLPIMEEGATTSTLHKLPLTSMSTMPAESVCEVTVTVYDPTTTETASSSISVKMPAVPVVDEAPDAVIAPVDESTTVTEPTDASQAVESTEPAGTAE